MSICPGTTRQPIGLISTASASILILLASLALAKEGHAKNPASIGGIAEEISVRIEGATQGSGVLVEKTSNQYKVLTAWHVLKGQNQNEELDIITSDGKVHTTTGLTISRIPNVDLATITFTSNNKYSLAKAGQSTRVQAGEIVFVYGYPLPTTTVGKRIARFLRGEVIANASTYIKDGYQLIYSNPTLPGMSGGPVLDSEGNIIGIHGRGETDFEITQQAGVAVKTGNNLAVPISYFTRLGLPLQSTTRGPKTKTYDDHIAMAVLAHRANDYEALRDSAMRAIQTRKSIAGYYYLSYAYKMLGQKGKSTIASYKGLKIKPMSASEHHWRGSIKVVNSINFISAYKDFKVAYKMEPSNRQYATDYSIFSPGL